MADPVRNAAVTFGPKFFLAEDGTPMFEFDIDGGNKVGPRPATAEDIKKHGKAWDTAKSAHELAAKAKMTEKHLAWPPKIDEPTVKPQDQRRTASGALIPPVANRSQDPAAKPGRFPDYAHSAVDQGRAAPNPTPGAAVTQPGHKVGPPTQDITGRSQDPYLKPGRVADMGTRGLADKNVGQVNPNDGNVANRTSPAAARAAEETARTQNPVGVQPKEQAVPSGSPSNKSTAGPAGGSR